MSETAGLFIVAEETKVLIEEVVTVFKKHNPHWSSTRVIMSDKDFNEREAFSKCFPMASLVICLYHTLRSFRREITCEKMGITSGERTRCLEIIQQISYALMHQFHVEKLKATKLISVVSYFMENWDTIKNQWVSYFRDLNLNLGENTNNRLESTFNKIKNVCSRYSSLLQFFHEFISVLSVLRNERKHSKMMSILRKDVRYQNMNEWEKLFYDSLTEYAFSKVQKQLKFSRDMKPVCTKEGDHYLIMVGNKSYHMAKDHCNCSYKRKMELPCQHIFFLLKSFSLPLFDPALFHKRWTREYYETNESVSTPFEKQVITTVSSNIDTEMKFSQAQKFRKLEKNSNFWHPWAVRAE